MFYVLKNHFQNLLQFAGWPVNSNIQPAFSKDPEIFPTGWAGWKCCCREFDEVRASVQL